MRQPSYLILLQFISIASVHTALITPALPEIQIYFQVSILKAEWLVGWFLVGYMIGQLIYSPFANRFGRIFALRLGLTINLFALLLSLLAAPLHSFYILLIGRFLSALGSSAGLVCTFILINEIFNEVEARKVISYAIISFTVGAGLAVSVGGFMTTYFGWESCFVLLFVYSLFMLYLTRFIPETLQQPDKEATKLSKIIQNYLEGFSSSRLILFTFILALPTVLTYAFSAAGPIIAKDHLNLNPAQFGLWNLLNSLGMLLGGLISGKLSKYASGESLLIIGLMMLCLNMSLLLGYYFIDSTQVMAFFLLTGGSFLFSSLVFSSASAFASNAIPNKANASAVMNFINLAITVCWVFIMGVLPYNTFTQFLIVIFIPLVIALLLIIPALKSKKISPA